MAQEIELSISCHDCVRRGTTDCQDCLVSFVMGDEPESLHLTAEDARVTQLFVAEGLVPRLRFTSVGSTADPE